MKKLIFYKKNFCKLDQQIYPCAFGKGGIVLNKVEGDGATPIGTFPLRQVFYRPDRLKPPVTQLPVTALHRDMGWCDDVEDPLYNQLVILPYSGRHEVLWRDDSVYDLILVVGYNDDPVVPGKGSAIFIHLAKENYPPTEGCLAFSFPDLESILRELTPESEVVIDPNSV
ncbi:L,D-transpeptidase family protein [Candidatus Paracaedibacter symbiosus]|uniref:L,D-transpeptidase family protein n=1 Tax=Candidatus Paracaedibacter symbiosus TaxID=244582 RepID=UPI0006899C76|nr:L,D-transpeptidase family protein [Candidatus Paracaedibacter symbiosus]